MPHTKTKSDNDDSHARSAKAQKAEEIQMTKGHPMPAASRAHGDGTPEDGTSSATAGKAEKEAAATNAALTKEQHGRGHRKTEH